MTNTSRGSALRSRSAAVAILATLAAGLPPALDAQTIPRRDLVVDGEFGYVASLAVDRSGRIYVADAMAQQLYVFDASGSRLPSIGRPGSGPGEFQRVVSVVAARGDTLYTFDPNLQRITAFAPGASRAVAYTVQVPRVGNELGSYQLLVPSEGSFLLPFAQPRARGEASAPTVAIRTVSRNGSVGTAPLSRSPDRGALQIVRGSQRVVGPLPYGRVPAFAVAGDRVYHGWSENGDIPFFDLQGRRLGAIRTRAATTALDRIQLRALVDSYPAGTQRQEITEAVRDGRIPSTRPAWRQMLADDRGRLWVNVATDDDVVVLKDGVGLSLASSRSLSSGGAGSTPWWVFAPSGQRQAIYLLPNNVTLHQVSGGRAYGIEVDEDGVQRVVRFVVGT